MFFLAGLGVAAWSAPLTVDLSSREQSRQFYRAVYAASESVPMGFTGDVAAGRAGDTSPAFKEAVRLRVNFFRAFAGIGGEVQFTAAFNAKTQQAALVASANNSISHTPAPTSRFYTAEAAEAAGKSNLALVESGPDAITGYIRDPGANNRDVGHRRWILYPQTREMGTGDIPVSAGFNAANALWILDANAGTGRPATRQPYIAWPPAGYVPHTLVFPRWSLSVAGADFSQAFVSVRRNGTPLAVAIDGLKNGYAENTIVWAVDRQNPAAIENHPRPEVDTTYAVEVTNVLVGGAAQTYRYSVIVYDPDSPGPGGPPLTVNGPASPAVGRPNIYTVAAPAYFSRAQWRTVRFDPVAPRFDAESGGLGRLAAATGNYNPIVTDIRGAGSASFRLIHPLPVKFEQTLTLPDEYYSGNEPAVLTFLSRLGYASARQLARVQISTDGGVSWSDVYQQLGDGTSGEPAFRTRTVSLGAYTQRTFRVRFNFTFFNGGSLFSQSDPGVGWYLDDIALTGVRAVTPTPAADVTGGSFAFTPSDASETGLQARGLIDIYPGEWSPVVTAFAAAAPPPVSGGTDPAPAPLPAGSPSARIANLSVRTAAGNDGDALTVGFNLSGTGTKPVLVRAIGPTLGIFGVTGVLADPLLRLNAATGAEVTRNDNWAGAAAIAAAAGRVGAFPIDAASRDAATLPSLAPGSYTATVTPAAAGIAPGAALVELYDAESATGSRLANVSARAQVGTGGDVLTVGFAINGTGNRNLLIRAVGPTLGAFGVPGVLADPKLEVFKDGVSIRTSDNWHPSLAPAFGTVGAFALQAGSRDAALTLSLPPGSYTAQVSGNDGTTGAALVEVYELP